MKITERKIGELIPYENNPRYNDEAVDYVAKSIKEFGFNVPIVIDKDNVIVAGHTRLRAAEKLGLEKVPCVTVNNLTDEQIKAYRLVDNKTAEMSEWDYDLLEMELEAIDMDMSEYGFEAEINAFELLDDVGYEPVDELEHFEVTFVFPKECEADVRGYIKENGKDGIVEMIIDKCRGGNNAD